MKHAVVVCHLGAPLDGDADAIASVTGLAPYDVRLRLGGILPSVLVWTATLDEGLSIQAKLRRHGVMVVDPRTIAPAADIVRVRRFSIGADRFHPNDHAEAIPFADISALIRATTTTAVLRKMMIREPVYVAPGRPLATEEREHMRHETASSNLLYIVPSEGPSLLMVSHEAKYLSLGAAMRATEHDNFLATIELLRRAAPHAVYDERFASRAHDSRQLAVARGSDAVEAKGDDELDLLVHALARWLTRGSGSPYRDPKTSERS